LNRANELVQIEQAKKTITGSKTEQEEFEEIASMLNMTTSHVREMVNISRDMISLDAEINNSENDKTQIGDFYEDFRYGKPEDNVMKEAMEKDIDNVLNSLRKNEADVIRMRFGLNGIKPMSLKEVGSVCNLTKERIRQIEKHAISRMQHPSRRKRLESYVA
jgi:RNA polymerase primary sigma factor